MHEYIFERGLVILSGMVCDCFFIDLGMIFLLQVQSSDHWSVYALWGALDIIMFRLTPFTVELLVTYYTAEHSHYSDSYNKIVFRILELTCFYNHVLTGHSHYSDTRTIG